MKIWEVQDEGGYSQYFSNENVADKYYKNNIEEGVVSQVYQIEIDDSQYFRNMDTVVFTYSYKDGVLQDFTFEKEQTNNIDFKTKDQVLFAGLGEAGSFNLTIQLEKIAERSTDGLKLYAHKIAEEIRLKEREFDNWCDMEEFVDYRWNNKGYYLQT